MYDWQMLLLAFLLCWYCLFVCVSDLSYLLLLEKSYFWLDSDLAFCSRSLSLSSIVLPTRLACSVASFLFLFVLFFQSNMPVFCIAGHKEWQDAESWILWSKVFYLLSLGAFSNILVNIIFFREIEQFEASASSFGFQAMRQSETRKIFLLPSFYNDQVESTEIASTVQPQTDLPSSPWTGTGMPFP